MALLAQDRRIKLGQDELRTLQKPRGASVSSLSSQSDNLEDTLLKLEKMRKDISKISAIHYA